MTGLWRLSAVVLAATLLSCLGTVSAANPAHEALLERAQALFAAYGQPRDLAHMDSLSTALGAMADTLETSGELATASRALERAGILAFRRGDLATADARWRAGLELARRSGDRSAEASLLNATAVGVSAGGDLERGSVLFAQLVELRRELGDRRGEGVTLSNLARAYLELYRLPEGDRALRRALECHREVGNTAGLVTSYLQRSSILLELGDGEQALAMVDSAVALAGRAGLERELAAGLLDRGNIREQLGEVEAGLADIERGLETFRAREEWIPIVTGEINRAYCLIELGRLAEAAARMQELAAELKEREQPREEVVARTAAGLAMLESGDLAGATDFLQETILALEELRDELDEEESRVGAFRLGGSAYASLARCLLARGDVESAWAWAERGRAARLRGRLGSDGAAPVTLHELQRRLGEIDAQLLHYSDLSRGERVAFVVRPDTLLARTLTMPRGLGDDLATAGYLMGSGADDAMILPVLGRIAAVVLHPLESWLDPDRERLLVSLPKGFAGLPLEHLSTSAAPGSVLDRWAVTEVPSATALITLMDRDPAEGPPLALADPRLEPVEDTEFELAARYRGAAAVPLPESRREAERVAGVAGVIAVGEQAGKERLRGEEARSAGALHFATHVVVDPVRPAASALLLAGRGREAALTAAEVEELELGADLVALSGCRTGEGLPFLGEGTLGLARSFLLAGARSVVMSRWDVEDAAARRFMEEFYDSLRAGLARDQALRAATRTLAAEGVPLRDRGAFVLAGVPSGPVASLLDPVSAVPAAGSGPRWLLTLIVFLGLFGLMRTRARTR